MTGGRRAVTPRRRSYGLAEVAVLIARFAALSVATEWRRSAAIEAELADLEGALERVPERFYEVLVLRGLKRRLNVEAARILGVHRNTASRRYMAGIRWMHRYLNHPVALPALRHVDWRDWALSNSEEVAEAFESPGIPGPGRPAQIPFEVDKRILELHCGGSTEREIVAALNAAFPRTEGRAWTRASVRSVLRRYNAPRRPRGRRRARGSMSFGDVEKPNYREIEFGQPLCDPSKLLANALRVRKRRTPH
jgi:hypothetical protein